MTRLDNLGQLIPQGLIDGGAEATSNALGITARLRAVGLPAVGATALEFKAAWQKMRAQETADREALYRQAAECFGYARQSAAKPRLTRARVREMLRNAQGMTSTAKPAGGLSLKQRIANAIAETPITARPATGRRHYFARCEAVSHEAAHVLAALAFDAAIGEVSVIPESGGLGGYVTFNTSRLTPAQTVCVAVIGAIYQRRRWGGWNPSPEDHGIRDRALAKIGDRHERDRVHEEGIALANDILTKNSRLLGAIENALIDHERLTGAELNALLSGQKLYH